MQVREPQIVTPEAVGLEFQTAGIGSRGLARLIDTVIQAVLLVGLFGGLGAAGSSSGGLGTAAVVIALVGVFVILFGYPAGFETLWRGRTPGKAVLGLRVMTAEGAPARFRHAAIRSALQLIDLLLLGPAVGVLAMLFSSRDQRLGDMVAGTVVVRERSGARPSAPVVFQVPYGYEGYVARLDVSGLTSADYETVRAVLVRGATLAPQVRWNLAARLAAPLAMRLHHTPPPGMSPDLFLACLAAAYQARHGGPSQWGPPVPPRPEAGPLAGPPVAAPDDPWGSRAVAPELDRTPVGTPGPGPGPAREPLPPREAPGPDEFAPPP